jgi:hypothetical protein
VSTFGKISMAHFDPAVTLGFLITKHITKIQLVYYLCAEIIGPALLLGILAPALAGTFISPCITPRYIRKSMALLLPLLEHQLLRLSSKENLLRIADVNSNRST